MSYVDPGKGIDQAELCFKAFASHAMNLKTYWMTGSIQITDAEKQEMREDASDIQRKLAFSMAREHSQKGNLDDYIDFLSENMQYFNLSPSPKITKNFKL